MWIRLGRGVVGFAVVWALAGCGPKAPDKVTENDAPGAAVTGPPGTQATGAGASIAALVAEWQEVADDLFVNELGPRAFEIAAQLAATGPEGLVPLLDILASSESGPSKKVFVVQCVAAHVTAAHVDRLAEMTAAQEEATTRSCAAALLAEIGDPRSFEVLKKLVEDGERRVRLSALLGLARAGDAPSQSVLAGLFSSLETSEEERLQIVPVFLRNPDEEGREVLAEAVKHPALEGKMRTAVAVALGRVGDAPAIEALEESKAVAADEAYNAVADSAVAAIEERLEPSAENGN